MCFLVEMRVGLGVLKFDRISGHFKSTLAAFFVLSSLLPLLAFLTAYFLCGKSCREGSFPDSLVGFLLGPFVATLDVSKPVKFPFSKHREGTTLRLCLERETQGHQSFSSESDTTSLLFALGSSSEWLADIVWYRLIASPANNDFPDYQSQTWFAKYALASISLKTLSGSLLSQSF